MICVSGNFRVQPNLLIACIVLVIFTTCKSRRPAGILSEQEMVHVLMEIYLAEEKISRAYIPYDSVSRISPVIRQRILNRVNVPDSVFKASIDYYMARPQALDRIYGVLIDSLSFREHRMPSPDAIPR